jgi:sugar phosphate isomerase/epimerase
MGDPLDAIATLGRHIRHVHLKDAILSEQPGTLWGKETRLGEGQVPLASLLEALLNVDYAGPLVIENEFDETLDGLRAALATLQQIR